MGLNGKLAGPWWTLRNKRHFVISDFAIEDFYCMWIEKCAFLAIWGTQTVPVLLPISSRLYQSIM